MQTPRASFALLLFAVSSVHAGHGGRSLIERNEASAHEPVSLHVGDPLRITLAETASTGYTWRVPGGCAAILKAGEEQMGPAGEKPGAPRARTWSFVGAAPGSCALTFQSARVWEATTTGKSVSFAVTVLP